MSNSIKDKRVFARFGFGLLLLWLLLFWGNNKVPSYFVGFALHSDQNWITKRLVHAWKYRLSYSITSLTVQMHTHFTCLHINCYDCVKITTIITILFKILKNKHRLALFIYLLVSQKMYSQYLCQFCTNSASIGCSGPVSYWQLVVTCLFLFVVSLLFSGVLRWGQWLPFVCKCH